MRTRLYQCFHDHGSRPDPKYLSSIRPELLCGASLDWRHTDDINCELKDNTGDNISLENTQCSELTGVYWSWKNDSNLDIVGIEHYRRHFIKHDAVIDDYVHTEDLLTAEDFENLLSDKDFVVPVHESLWNTSVYDLYVICFGKEQADNIIKWMGKYYKRKSKYYNALLNHMSRNELYRGNMFVTTKAQFDEYCNELFGLIDYMKCHMEVKPDSRVWGYVSEIFPMIYIMANKKSFVEADVAVDDFDQNIRKAVIHTTQNNQESEFTKDPQIQIDYFESLINGR